MLPELQRGGLSQLKRPITTLLRGSEDMLLTITAVKFGEKAEKSLSRLKISELPQLIEANRADGHLALRQSQRVWVKAQVEKD